jgi:hypothetical protein
MNRERGAAIGVCVSLLLVALPVRFAYAIEGGESALGENIVTLINIRGNGTPWL